MYCTMTVRAHVHRPLGQHFCRVGYSHDRFGCRHQDVAFQKENPFRQRFHVAHFRDRCALDQQIVQVNVEVCSAR